MFMTVLIYLDVFFMDGGPAEAQNEVVQKR